ncbi:MAG: DeoR/GlpR family DNA-binding transcription regulator [Corynebacterium sp.]|nr:DeoR/GlpR family DNA-binding transcription regulator [Corynebacterium sp.]
MYAEERRRQIASLAAVAGRVNVTELADRFEVTAETIRRDLAILDHEGSVQRVHGGAVASQNFQTTEYTLDVRARSAQAAKRAIARTALQFLPEPGSSIFFDSGTTLGALGDLFTKLPTAQQYSVTTNSLPISLAMSSAGLNSVQLLGGNVRAITQAVVGDTALRTLALIRADVAFVGTNALTVDHGLSTADAQEAAVKRAMIMNARKVIVLCDSSKLGCDYLVSFSTIGDIDVLITDSNAPSIFIEQLRLHGIDVVIADTGNSKN